MADDVPDDPALLKQMLVQMFSERQVDKDQIVELKEQIKLWRKRFSGASQSKLPILRHRSSELVK